MTILRGALAGLALTGALAASGGAVRAETAPTTISDVSSRVYPGETYTQYYYGRRYYRGGYGGAAAAGVAGLAAGALIGGAIASSGPGYAAPPGTPVGNVYGHDPNWVSYCASRYRSFDPASGTYLARDGVRYYCQ